MKYSPRVVSSCESCRRLKRKCDFTLTKGPCSNCVMRNIGHLCSLPGDRPNNVNIMGSNSQENTPRSLPSPPGSNGNGSNIMFHSNATSPSSQASVFSSPYMMPSPTSDVEKQSQSASVSASRMPPKFLLACAVRFFQTPELSFYLDEYEVMTSIFDLARGLTDLNKLSLLYILCADILLRRGAQVSALFGYTGDRFQLANELVDIHLKTCQLQPTNTIEACRALLLRGQFYTDSGNEEQGFKALDMAVSSFNSIINEDSTGATEAALQASNLAKSKVWLAICTLEGTLCGATKTHRRRILPLQRTIEYVDFKDQRRMKLLQFSQRVSNILDDNQSIINDQQISNALEDLCIEMHQYVSTVDEMEGKLHPYGQVELFISLIKIRTRQVLELGPNTQYHEVRDGLLSQLMNYSNELANRVEIFSTVGSLSPYGLSCLASGPNLAYTVFQGLTCIWILSTLTDREFLLEQNFTDVRTRIFNLLDNLKGDYKICKHTHGLFTGLEILSQAQKDEESGLYRFKIPVELEPGISSISKRWNENFQDDKQHSISDLSPMAQQKSPIQEEQEQGWSEFNPLADDQSLWQFILTQKDDFDTSIYSFSQDLLPNSEMVILA